MVKSLLLVPIDDILIGFTKYIYKEGMKNYCLSYNFQHTKHPNSTLDKDRTQKRYCDSIWNYIRNFKNEGRN